MTNFLSGKITSKLHGGCQYYKNGKLHREAGPAEIYKSGYKVWYKNGLCHNENGPARVFSSGTVHWILEERFYYSTPELWAKAVVEKGYKTKEEALKIIEGY